ncbi:MAG: hypothetical protein ABIJ09_25215 [Pseudomonadota bacterium]
MAALLLAPAASGVAVVPVSFGDVAPPAEMARALGQALQARQLEVLDPAALHQRMLRGGWPVEVDVETLRRDVEKAVPPAEVKQAVLRLQDVVAALENDPRSSDDKIALLQRARLVLARELYNQGFLASDRKATETLQREIFKHLEAAVRADPYISMPLETFSPEVRRLLDLARRRVAEAPRAVLQIQTEAQDAAVFVDGREMGRLPTAARSSLPLGSYRVWLAREGCRSRTYRLDLTSQGASVDIDLDFDCAVRPDEGSLRFAPGQRIRNSVAVRLAELLDVSTLILLGVTPQDDGQWLFAARYDLSQQRAVRQGAVRMDPEQGADLAHLADFLSAGVPRAPADLPFDLPFEGIPRLNAPVAGAGAVSSTGGTAKAPGSETVPSPLLLAGVSAASAGVLGLVVGAVGFGVWSSAYSAIDNPAAGADLDAMYSTAKLGWNVGWVGSVVGVVALAAGGGLLGWWALAPGDPPAPATLNGESP